MSATFFRYDNSVITTQGEAVPGALIAVLDQPADTSTEPGSPLATIWAAPTSNAPTVTAAAWLAGMLSFALASIPADLILGSYFSVEGSNPSAYNGIYQVFAIDSVNGIVYAQTTVNPGTYISGAVMATSALPNPFQSDNLGNFFFYTDPGIVTVQIYDPLGRVSERVLADQNIVAGGGNGSVTSVGLTLPDIFDLSGSPISSAGTFAVTLATQGANFVLAGPVSGPDDVPAFRALVPADFPAGVGTLSSVGLTVEVPSILSVAVTGSPLTTDGTIDVDITLANQTANLVFASATSGGSAAPTFRGLVSADLPASPVFTGTITFTLAGIQVFANNAAAISGGLTAGQLYRTGANPDPLCIVH